MYYCVSFQQYRQINIKQANINKQALCKIRHYYRIYYIIHVHTVYTLNYMNLN